VHPKARWDVPSEVRATWRATGPKPGVPLVRLSPTFKVIVAQTASCPCPIELCSSGSLAFPAPSMAFTRCRVRLRGVPTQPALIRFGRIDSRPSWPWPPLQRPRSRAETALAVSPLLGFIQRPPLLRLISQRVHSHEPREGPASASRQPDALRVPPSWIRTTSAVYSSSRMRVYCAPLPDLGFTAFRGSRCHPATNGVVVVGARSPQCVVPSKYPLASSRTASPRPLPSCSCLDAVCADGDRRGGPQPGTPPGGGTPAFNKPRAAHRMA